MVKVPFYIKALRVLAPIIIFFGACSLLIGISAANGSTNEAALVRYLGVKTSGQAIDRGAYRIFIGIIVGAIAEIGFLLVNMKNKE